MIAIIDYGLGNVKAIKTALDILNVKSVITSNYEDIENCNKIILPGVGTFDNAMKKIQKNNLDSILINKIKDSKVKLLGICIGMQILSKKSEEGICKGLGLVEGEIIKFKYQNNKKIPHLGWNFIYDNKNIKLFDGINDPKYYFLHSYHFIGTNDDTRISISKFGNSEFIAAINYKNIYGVQFHPEKSHHYGLKLLKNFASL